MAVSGRVAQLQALWKRGWDEIPGVLGSTGIALIGCAFGVLGYFKQKAKGGFSNKYMQIPVVMRPGDPRLKRIRNYSGLDD